MLVKNEQLEASIKFPEKFIRDELDGGIQIMAGHYIICEDKFGFYLGQDHT